MEAKVPSASTMAQQIRTAIVQLQMRESNSDFVKQQPLTTLTIHITKHRPLECFNRRTRSDRGTLKVASSILTRVCGRRGGRRRGGGADGESGAGGRGKWAETVPTGWLKVQPTRSHSFRPMKLTWARQMRCVCTRCTGVLCNYWCVGTSYRY